MQCNNWELGPYTLVLKALNESSHPTVTTSSQSEARFGKEFPRMVVEFT